MKTIEEAAKELANVSMLDFIAEAEFVQMWISVEEKLPKKGNHGFSDKVLTTDKHGNIQLERYDYEFNRFNVVRYDSKIKGDGQVTHWKPIELK